jgi:hypothetical protein
MLIRQLPLMFRQRLITRGSLNSHEDVAALTYSKSLLALGFDSQKGAASLDRGTCVVLHRAERDQRTHRVWIDSPLSTRGSTATS